MPDLNRAAVVQIPLHHIVVDPDRIRKEISTPELMELVLSIRARGGLIHPIIVERLPQYENKYRLVAGERRFRAHQKLHEFGETDSIAARILDELPDDERLAIELEENLRRQTLTWQDRADGLQRLLEIKRAEASLGLVPGRSRVYTQSELAKELGMDPSTVSRDLELANYMASNPELKECEKRVDALRRLRQLRRGEKIIRNNEMELYQYEKFLITDITRAPRATGNLVILDLCNRGLCEELLDFSKSMLATHGQLIVFFDPQFLTPLARYLRIPAHPSTVIIKDYMFMFLWYSLDLKRPTGRLEVSYTYNKGPGPFPYSKPQLLYNRFLALLTTPRETVVHINCQDISCARVAIEANREILLIQESSNIWDKLRLYAMGENPDV